MKTKSRKGFIAGFTVAILAVGGMCAPQEAQADSFDMLLKNVPSYQARVPMCNDISGYAKYVYQNQAAGQTYSGALMEVSEVSRQLRSGADSRIALSLLVLYKVYVEGVDSVTMADTLFKQCIMR